MRPMPRSTIRPMRRWIWLTSLLFTTAAAAVTGDLNRDGRVDFDDFFILTDNFGKVGAPEAPDTIVVVQVDTLREEHLLSLCDTSLVDSNSIPRYWLVSEGLEFEWVGIWFQRGPSNLFDAIWSNGRFQVTGGVEITIEGDRIAVDRFQTSDDNLCTYQGVLTGLKAEGTYTCTNNKTPLNWVATLSRP